MLSPLESSWSVRFRKRSLLATLLATCALIVLYRSGPGKASTGWAAFLAGPPSHASAARAQTTMALKTVDNDENLKKAAEIRAAFEARKAEEQVQFPDEDKRGFLGQLRPGKKPSVLDIIADPGLAFDDRFPKTDEMAFAMQTRSDFETRHPEVIGIRQPAQLPSSSYGGPIWPISGEIVPYPNAPKLAAASEKKEE